MQRIHRVNIGAPGYIGARTGYRSRRRRFNRRGRGRGSALIRKVQRIVMDKMVEKANIQLQTYTRIASTVNASQGYATVLVQNSQGDLTTIYNNINAPSIGPSGPFGGTPATAVKYTITGYVADIMMKNQTNASVIIEMYELFPRHDLKFLPSQSFANGFTDQGSTGQDVKWGCSPFMCNAFTVMFKINNKRIYMLAPGATEIINFRDSKNYLIDYERLNQTNTAGLIGYKGLSRYFFAIVKGEPVNDSSTKTLVNSGPYAVDFFMNEVYYYTFLPLAVVSSSLSSALGTITTGNSVLIDTGATVTPANS